jgi:hypothetical protein
MAQRFAVAGGNWSSTSTWAATAGGASGASVPTSADSVIIPGNITVILDVANASCLGLNLNNTTANTTAQLTFNSGTTLTTRGFTLTSNNANRMCTINMTSGGTLKINGTVTLGTGKTLTAGLGTVEYSGAAQTVWATSYNNLILSGTGAKTTTTITVNGSFVMGGNAAVTASAVPTYGASAKLIYNKTAAFTTGVEWPATFSGTGGVEIKNGGGAITLGGAKVLGTDINVPLNINSGATLTPGANLITLHGDFINSGTLTSGSGGITISGTAASQSIAGFTTTGTVSMTKTSGTATFTGDVNGAGLTINGSGGTLDLGTSLTHVFTGTWTRTNGTLNGGSSTVKFSNSTAFSGTAGTFTAGTGTVEYSGGAQDIAAVTYQNLKLSGSGLKTFSGASTTISGDMFVESGVRVELVTDATHTARTLSLGGVGLAAGIYGGANATATGLTKKTDFFGSNSTTSSTGVIQTAALSPLPVTLSNFTAKQTTDKKVSLAWITSSETVNKGFSVERQEEVNGKFQSLAFINSKAEGGNSQSILAYSFKDLTAKKGINIYRLVQEDIDGKKTYSEVRMIKLTDESVSSVFPNPSNGAININRTNDSKKMNIQVIDMAGRMVQQINNTTDSNMRININKSGIYNIKMTYPETGEQSIQRVVIQK